MENATRTSKDELNARLIQCTHWGNSKDVRECLSMGANPNATEQSPNSITDGQTALHIAAGKEHEGVVDILLAAGASPNLTDRDGTTPLFLAVSHNCWPSLLYKLLEAGALPDTGHDDTGRFAIHLAVLHGFLPLLDALIKHKANVNAMTQMESRTPLHLAAIYGQDAIIRRLLDCGASSDMPDIEGQTPLHHAARGKFEKACEILLDHGALTDVTTSHGKTPADIWDRVAEIAAGVSERQLAHFAAENRARMKRLGALQHRGPGL